MPTMSFDERQEAVLGFILSFWLRLGYAPSLREIKDGVPLSSTSVVAYHIRELERRGLVRRGSYADSRTLQPVGPPCPACGCPGGHDADV